MFYRKDDLGYWLTALRVKIPLDEGVLILDIRIRKNEYGWEWHDQPPQEYEDFIQAQAEYENWKQTQ
jgi:hypothetical protein